MANKHSPKKISADFGNTEHYYFEIEPMQYYSYHLVDTIGAQVVKAQSLAEAQEKVKHLPYRCSGLIQIPRSEYLEILSRPFFKIQLRTKNGWQFLEEIFQTTKAVELALDYWRQVSPDSEYQAIKCEALDL